MSEPGTEWRRLRSGRVQHIVVATQNGFHALCDAQLWHPEGFWEPDLDAMHCQACLRRVRAV